jgi:hypothetical protein
MPGIGRADGARPRPSLWQRRIGQEHLAPAVVQIGLEAGTKADPTWMIRVIGLLMRRGEANGIGSEVNPGFIPSRTELGTRQRRNQSETHQCRTCVTHAMLPFTRFGQPSRGFRYLYSRDSRYSVNLPDERPRRRDCVPLTSVGAGRGRHRVVEDACQDLGSRPMTQD